MALDCGKPPYVETSKFSKIDYRDIPHKDIIQQDLEGCTCDSSDNFLSGTAYTNCQSEPFGGAPITLDNVAGDISSLPDGVPADVTITSFPCITTSSQQVDFSSSGFSQFPNLEEVRFANWVTGPDGFFKFADLFGEGSLTSIYAPRLTGTQSLDIFISDNPNLPSVDLCALMEARSVDIFRNRELVDVKLSELTTVATFIQMIDNKLLEQLSLPKLRTTSKILIRDNENLVGISMPVLETSSNQFWVLRNPALQTLCAPNLVDGGIPKFPFDGVCIGDESNQPSLDADLSSLVTGSFTGFSDDCYGGIDPPTNQLNATTVCGVVPDGLFTTAGCSVTSKACKNTKKTKKGKKNKP
ncbi:hypothetical protein PPROV_000567000 [Pycnococcus provasolii]|uniref:Receptor L-domain domain-containing protein n=1 Tax=Pycnococcus provasolii TaxID=41880 RepID=A0A830HHY0_9CHLO|nr:hypothetical protein PPROV_000567000 [Pycnococcus provasolii]